MNSLLESAVAAHGGLDRWNQVKSITFDASITGAFWHLKGKGDALKNVRLEVNTTRQLVTIDFAGQDKQSVFEPHRVVVQRHDGTLIDARDDPENRLTVISSTPPGTTFISPTSRGKRSGRI
jgi:hypothetical protein